MSKLKYILVVLSVFAGLAAIAQSTVNDDLDEVDGAAVSVSKDVADMQQAQDTTSQEEVDTENQAVIVDYAAPKKYVIADISVSGVKYSNTDQIIGLSGLSVGDTIAIPGESISQAMKKLWTFGMFSDVKVNSKKVAGDKIYLDIYLQERARILSYSIEGIKKGDREDLQNVLTIKRGSEYSAYLRTGAVNTIKKFYYEKGFRNVTVDVVVNKDSTLANGVRLLFVVDKKGKVRVKEIEFEGNKAVKPSQLRGAMKEIHRRRWYTFFWSSKYIDDKLAEDKAKILEYYNERGYRDARILSDSVWVINGKHVGIKFKMYEGHKYYYRNLTWVGNSRYPSDMLTDIMRIRKGDIYDKVTMEKRLLTEDNSVTTMYMDDGYLFFNVQPVEVRVEGDSVDIEMRIYEGKQATVSNIYIQGNSKTNEHVIRRELFIRPGDLFSKTQIVRSIRDLAQMGHFDPEKLDAKPTPNPADETVDLTFVVEEKPNDQLELSGGWGAGMFVGTVGVKLANFSTRRMFDKDGWRPLPTGDNQTLTLRGQTNGSYYKAISTSFTEPWLGGRKPISLTTSAYYTNQNNSMSFYQSGTSTMEVVGLSVGIGQRLKWPDNYFTLYNSVDLQRYILDNWTSQFIFSDGASNNFSFKIVLGRNSTDQPIYPRRGSEFSLGLQITPPYSLFSSKDYSDPDMKDSERYKWIEYHKWTFRTAWFTSIVGNLVFALKAQFGYLGYFNSALGYSPFEGFTLGGDGMSGYNLYGVETIGLRGYQNGALTAYSNGAQIANVYDKYTVELRYPFVLSPQSTIYGLAFFEAGNSWSDLSSFSPFSVKRSAGVGIRLMLPMIGLLGVDFGYGFDKVQGASKANGWEPHFIIGMPF
ncbi:MAG: outer membrane protein assembly factor BamA [Prevotellaceae bacterium]|jgi:outer membrane protein insertion porin family|nr:outer membrane protein assembly factor BamA [Prevotellaceae bacterium]